MTTMAPDTVNESLDPRDPLLRLSTFFDDGTVELLHERDRSGVLAGAGTCSASDCSTFSGRFISSGVAKRPGMIALMRMPSPWAMAPSAMK